MSESIDVQPSEVVPRCGAKLRNRDAYCKQVAGARTNHPGTGRCWIHGGATPVRSGRYSTVTRREIAELITQLESDPDPLNILPDLNMVRALLIDFLNRYEENRDAVLAWYASWNGRPWKPEQLQLLVDVLESYVGRMKDDESWEDPSSVERQQLERGVALAHSLQSSFITRPREVLDIADGHRMAVEASKMVERIEKIRARGAVSREDFVRVMGEITRTAETVLSPAKIRTVLSDAGADVTDLSEEALMRAADALRNALSDSWLTIRVV